MPKKSPSEERYGLTELAFIEPYIAKLFQCEGCHRVRFDCHLFTHKYSGDVCCVHCRDGNPDFEMNNALRNQVLALMIRCPNKRHGCKAHMKVAGLLSHLRNSCKKTKAKRDAKKALRAEMEAEKKRKEAKPEQRFGELPVEPLGDGQHEPDGILSHPEKPKRFVCHGYTVKDRKEECKKHGVRWMDKSGAIRVLHTVTLRYDVASESNWKSTAARNKRKRRRHVERHEGGTLKKFKSEKDAIAFREEQRKAFGGGFVHRDDWFFDLWEVYQESDAVKDRQLRRAVHKDLIEMALFYWQKKGIRSNLKQFRQPLAFYQIITAQTEKQHVPPKMRSSSASGTPISS